jgi:hypothetical protein
MNLPTIGSLFQISKTDHPRAKAMSPQGDSSLWLSTLHTQHPQTHVLLLQQFKSSSSLFSPQPALPKECTPFTAHSPSGVPFVYQGPYCTWLSMNLSFGHSMNSQLLQEFSQQPSQGSRDISSIGIHTTCLQPDL